MAMHTQRERTKLLARVRRIRGQVDAIERALQSEVENAKVMHLIAAVRGATAGLMAEVLEDHIRHHLVPPGGDLAALDPDAVDELVETLGTYLK